MICVGEKVRFDPYENMSGVGIDSMRGQHIMIGEVVEVNYLHKWFSVEYGCPAMRTSFKFCDIGSVVKVVG